jgi:hypothetical protein
VVATGNEVGAFSGVLQVSTALTGVTPAIGSTPVIVHHDQPFEVSWAPEGKGDATVLLSLGYPGGICFCDAPDSAGKVVVDGNLLSPTTAEQKGRIRLARLTTATVSSTNATIDLVGAVVQAGPLQVQ